MRLFAAPVLVALLSLAAACGDDGTTSTGTTSGGDGGSSGDGGSDQGGSTPTTTGTGTTTSTGATTGSTTATGTSTSTGEGGGTTGQGGDGGAGQGGDGGAGQGGDGGAGQGGDGGAGQGGDGGAGTTAATTSATTATTSTGGGPDCTAITAEDFALYQAQLGDYASYIAAVQPNLGGAEVDAALLEFYGPAFGADGGATGAFDLTANGDGNYATCSRCIRVFDDSRLFFQESGTLTVTAASDQLNGVVDATIANLRLVEVTIDPVTFVSTPVAGGACLELASATVSFDATEPPATWTCDPTYWFDGECDCGCGEVDYLDCGDASVDACLYCDNAGSCSEDYVGCPGIIDPEDTGSCVDVGACTVIEPGGDLFYFAAQSTPDLEGIYGSLVAPDLGIAGEDDVFALFFYSPATGAFDLASAVNASITTCEQCALVYEDDAGPTYFQTEGSITLADTSDPLNGFVEGTLSGVRLVEVDANGAPIPGGGCVLIPSLAFTTP